MLYLPKKRRFLDREIFFVKRKYRFYRDTTSKAILSYEANSNQFLGKSISIFAMTTIYFPRVRLRKTTRRNSTIRNSIIRSLVRFLSFSNDREFVSPETTFSNRSMFATRSIQNRVAYRSRRKNANDKFFAGRRMSQGEKKQRSNN